jgi:hypothetical protein
MAGIQVNVKIPPFIHASFSFIDVQPFIGRFQKLNLNVTIFKPDSTFHGLAATWHILLLGAFGSGNQGEQFQ